MSRHLGSATCLIISTVMMIVLSSGARCAAATPEQVEQAIAKASTWILSRQNKDFTWEQVAKPELNAKDDRVTDFKARQWGGLTSIATYALLAGGMNPQEPQLKHAIEFLQKANIQSTYALGLNSQIWLMVPITKETRAVMNHNVQMLEAGMIKKGEWAGFYGYWTGVKKGSDQPRWTDNLLGYVNQPGWAHDCSNSQYAVLGMWALAEAGAEVPTEYWKKVEDAWKKQQQSEGGWRYNEGREVTASMTAAGIATLFITQDYTMPDRWGVCQGGLPNQAIDNGLKWMDQHIEDVLQGGDLYTMYGIERIGVASGRKYFGTVDWYRKGADNLVARQAQDGSWGDLKDTCFALLFLARGSAPVMMNKVQYASPLAPKGVVDAWDQRPRDIANLARWTGRELERDLNWQIVNLKVAPEELHDAPILYFAGSLNLTLPDDQVAKLRAFVEQGGMMLGNADCADSSFTRGFKYLGKKLFPRYEFRELPATHPIYTRQQYRAVNWRSKPKVLSLSNGVRELMVLVPEADPSRAWQARADRTKQDLFQLGADIFLYSVDKKNLLNKGDTYVVQPDDQVQATRKLRLARIVAGDNPDPEPGGWRRLSAIFHNTYGIDLTVANAVPGEGSLVGGAQVAHLTGTTTFKLSDSARLEIKTFVEGGGTLIVDAAGGSPEFATSAEAELRTIFGPLAKELDAPLPLSSPVYSQKELKIASVGYRAYAKDMLLAKLKEPRIRAITLGKRPRVFYSREDLSAGLVGQQVDGIYGYEPKTATDLMTALILYADSK